MSHLRFALPLLVLLGACRPATLPDSGVPDAGEAGACVDDCGLGAVCLRGACFQVTCPSQTCTDGEACVDGACVDRRCAGLSCPDSTVCVRGACYSRACGPTTCPADSVCDVAGCVEAACVGVTCGPGTACRNGECSACLDGFVARDGGCALPGRPGEGCGGGADCASGVCAGGRYCLTPCIGQCEGCSEEGLCRSLPRGHPGEPSCFPGRCGGDRLACIEDCLDDGDCATGAFCDRAGPTPRCLPRFSLGSACTREQQCASGRCLQGVCCDSACTGACETCNGLTPDGFPTPLPAGTCLPLPLGTFPRRSVDCGPYLCDGVERGCAASCVTDLACLSERWCGGSEPATCLNPLLGPGAPCSRDRQCASGLCVDGVCCTSRCAEDCRACNLPGQEGLCAGETGTQSADGGFCVDGLSCLEPCFGDCQRCVASTGLCAPRTDNGRLAACGNFACGSPADGGCFESCVPGTAQGCVSGQYCQAGATPQCQLLKPHGAACASHLECVSGTCCGGSCVDTSTNPNHCGGCGSDCWSNGSGYGSSCFNGACCEYCDGSECVDLLTNRDHCGYCWSPCSTDEECVGGACTPL